MDYSKLTKQQLLGELEQRDKQLRECDLMRMALQATQDRLAQIVNATPVGICITDDKGFFEQVNPAYCRLYGYAADELIGRHFTVMVPKANRKILSDLHDAFIQGGTEMRGEWQVVDKKGHEFTVLADAARIKGADEEWKKATFVMDVSEKKHYEQELVQANEKLESLARTDGLTGLINHRVILESLENEILRSQRSHAPLAVMLLDLDDFKQINDRYGHQTGDIVLQAVAGELLADIRVIDYVGRYGGEEFMVLLPGCRQLAATEVAERLRQKIAALSFDKEIQLTISIGLAIYDGHTPQQLVALADEQLYRAKGEGKNRVCYAH